MRGLRLLLLFAAAPFLIAGSCHPTIEEYRVAPELVCPGDQVTTRVIYRDAHAGYQTATPAPPAGGARVLYGRTSALTADERRYQICESTEFEVKFWQGESEAGCDAGHVRCAQAFASVVSGREAQEIHVDPCATSRFGSEARFDIAPDDYSETFVIEAIVNCGGRTVTLGREDGSSPPAMAGGGDPFVGFDGQPWVGRWTAAQTVFPGERCPVAGATAPIPTTPPPGICLRFVVGCPGSDDCT